jgi:hypothetical protein
VYELVLLYLSELQDGKDSKITGHRKTKLVNGHPLALMWNADPEIEIFQQHASAIFNLLEK